MIDLTSIKEHANVIGADGVHVGTVDSVADGRLKLTKLDSIDGHHHFIDGGLIAGIESGTVRLSANADVAILLEDDEATVSSDNDRLDEGLEETFPASDPVSAKHIS
jgi:hypothetical protein